MAATGSGAIYFGTRAVHRWHDVAADREEVRVGTRNRGLPWRWRTAIADSVDLLAIVWSIPLVMAVVGTPVVLTIALLLWLARLASSAF